MSSLLCHGYPINTDAAAQEYWDIYIYYLGNLSLYACGLDELKFETLTSQMFLMLQEFWQFLVIAPKIKLLKKYLIGEEAPSTTCDSSQVARTVR